MLYYGRLHSHLHLALSKVDPFSVESDPNQLMLIFVKGMGCEVGGGGGVDIDAVSDFISFFLSEEMLSNVGPRHLAALARAVLGELIP